MTRQLQHGPYEAGSVIYMLHTSPAGASTIGPMTVECCVPLKDCLHWRVEFRDGDVPGSVIVGWDGLASDGSVRREADSSPAAVEDSRSAVIRTALDLAATAWDNGRSTAENSMALDLAEDLFDDALERYVGDVNAARAGQMPKGGS